MDIRIDATTTDQEEEVFRDSLCERCLQLQEFAYHAKEGFANCGRNLEKFSVKRLDFRPALSSFQSCGLCLVFLRAAEKIGLISTEKLWTIDLYGVGKVEFGPYQTRIDTLEHSYQLSSILNQSCPWSLFPQTDSVIRDFRLIGLSTLDIATLWTNDCLSSHSLCPSMRKVPLPRKVLFIGGFPNQIRLFQTNNISGRYACLSHCWGNEQILTTTKGNLKAHEQSITWEHLPRTFQDAIKVAHHLGLEYLWIDSLCIVQDDEDDWIRESKSMCEVYRNSYLTIAATSAHDGSKGLFLKESNRLLEISGKTSAGMDFSLCMRKLIPWSHPKTYYELYPRWPLLSRAWVFQERLLSPRVIHFAEDELIWECHENTCCECDGDFLETWKENFHAAMIQPTKASLVQQWQEIIELYCPLKLSRGSDKLPAISGLAKQMWSMRPGEKYLAGLWSGSLATDLLWANSDIPLGSNLEESHMPAPWRAPSWSWASTNGRISYPRSMQYQGHSSAFTPEARKMDEIIQPFSITKSADTTLATSDATGKVRTGSISIKGPIFGCKFVARASPGYFGLLITESDYEVWQHSQALNRVFFDISMDPFRNGGKTSLPYGDIRCIRMARVKYIRERALVTELEYAMVLQKLTVSTSYQRIGMVILERVPELLKGLSHPEKMWEEFPSYFGEGGVMETVTIV